MALLKRHSISSMYHRNNYYFIAINQRRQKRPPLVCGHHPEEAARPLCSQQAVSIQRPQAENLSPPSRRQRVGPPQLRWGCRGGAAAAPGEGLHLVHVPPSFPTWPTFVGGDGAVWSVLRPLGLWGNGRGWTPPRETALCHHWG